MLVLARVDSHGVRENVVLVSVPCHTLIINAQYAPLVPKGIWVTRFGSFLPANVLSDVDVPVQLLRIGWLYTDLCHMSVIVRVFGATIIS